MLKKTTLSLAFAALILEAGAQTTNSADKDWTAQLAEIKGSMEAAYIIRVGDVDNLGFNFPEGFDPFCGRMTTNHDFPWTANPNDLPGFDRILLSSRFSPEAERQCGMDGYSGSYDPQLTKPVAYSVPVNSIKGFNIQNAFLQLFIDDFQAAGLCSKFTLNINGVRFVEAEKTLNAIDQTGPVGKLVSIPIPEEFYPVLNGGGLMKIMIDEATGSGDGFSLDFIRLLINRNRENTCKGDFTGFVKDKETNEPIAGARVSCADMPAVLTDADGFFKFTGVPSGFEVVGASFQGYNDGRNTADIGEGSDNPEVYVFLEKGAGAVKYDGKDIKAGESINLRKILFDQSKQDLRAESMTELDKIAAFMKANPTAEIELSGHTSSEGEAGANRSLSYRRVKACKDYIVSKGIETERIGVIGCGPDRPVAPNDNEANRAQNRRVEMRVLKL